MSLKTVTVYEYILLPTGEPAEGAVVTARLDRLDVEDSGYVTMPPVSAEADENGYIELPLWPNELGEAESRYLVDIEHEFGAIPSVVCVVPDVNGTLRLKDISVLPPFMGSSQGEIYNAVAQQAALDAQIAAAQAVSAADQVDATIETAVSNAVNAVEADLQVFVDEAEASEAATQAALTDFRTEAAAMQFEHEGIAIRTTEANVIHYTATLRMIRREAA